MPSSPHGEGDVGAVLGALLGLEVGGFVPSVLGALLGLEVGGFVPSVLGALLGLEVGDLLGVGDMLINMVSVVSWTGEILFDWECSACNPRRIEAFSGTRRTFSGTSPR